MWSVEFKCVAFNEVSVRLHTFTWDTATANEACFLNNKLFLQSINYHIYSPFH